MMSKGWKCYLYLSGLPHTQDSSGYSEVFENLRVGDESSKSKVIFFKILHSLLYEGLING